MCKSSAEMRTKMINQISALKVIPVAVIQDAKKAVPLAKALVQGGLPCIEVTFRTDAAAEAIKLIHNEIPDILVGAGTVTSCRQAELAIQSGARFIVSPGLNPEVVKYVLQKNTAMFPGIMTPSELEQAMHLDITHVKFFPAVAAGGISMIKALSAPYPDMYFMPTGGIKEDNILDFLACDKVFACGGSWMVDKKLIESEDFEEITKRTRRLVELVKKVR